jgi:flagellin
MAMTINTNVMSMNAQRNTIQNSASMATTLQRLSSGLRVNSSKDDAAGLAIATRMDTQVRGMNVAIRNANDGISLAQTAESGMNTITEMLQRMRELAVQASNSTNTWSSGANSADTDVAKLNDEYVQLQAEVQRTLISVSFNNQPLLSGVTTDFTFQVGANASSNGDANGQRITINASSLNIGATSGGMGGILTGTSQTLQVTSTNSSNTANITALDLAISTINSARAKLGAVQSRFENTISYLRSSVEQQASAKGRIMDADFAAETANLSRSQILQQAGTAMIAQANQVPQNVLSLLKG